MKTLMQRITHPMRTWLASCRAILNNLNTHESHQPVGCNNIMTLLLHLCDMDEAMRTWVLRWIAYQLRNPGAKMGTALVVNGSKFGKGIFFEDVLSRLFGDGARTIVADDLHSLDKRWMLPPTGLVTIHGSFNHRNVSRLRALVVSTHLAIERAGAAPTTCANELNFVFLTTASDLLPEQVGDIGRRLVIIESPPEWTRRYYEAVMHEAHSGGVDALREYLLHQLDMGAFDEHTPPPMARARKEAA